jgi:hypothetical protein
MHWRRAPLATDRMRSLPIVYMSFPTAIVVDDSNVGTEFGPNFVVVVVFPTIDGWLLIAA